MHGNIIDAMIHQIFANGVVTSGFNGYFQFGADAISGTDEDRLLPSGQRKACAETSNIGHHGFGKCFAGVGANETNGSVGFVNVYACVFVLNRFSGTH